ncbi:MAG: ABC transporter ATP-binding protein [Myxococcales bacterium FL481]|nr:MAG: ABC transporter ATP-binding protein [Myxococcales bacterium FL481]
MIELQNLSKIYCTEFVETHALSDVSLTVDRGEFISLSGPSGSGKTTLLNVLGLLDSFQRGTYHLEGEDLGRGTDTRLSRIRNQKIGFVFQAFNLMPDLNVRDNVELPLRYRRMPSAKRGRAAADALERVGLAGRMKHRPGQLSGGQQQRVAIARAIAGAPPILLADEPTGNLDSARAHDIMALLEGLNDEGTTIIMVTHSPECAARASRKLHILDGKLTDLAGVSPVAEDQTEAGASAAAPSFRYEPQPERAL